MFPTYQHAAVTYLDIWFYDEDQRYTQELSDTRDLSSSELHDGARKTLVEAATKYRVIRGFKVEETAERLEGALHSLQLSRKPNDAEEAILQVNQLVERLKGQYQKELVSAASKFLWFRYRNPVVIYDSLAYEGLRRLDLKPDGKIANDSSKWYAEYAREWRQEFNRRKDPIRAACNELPVFKRFTLVSGIEDKELYELVSHEWFQEGVFDAFLMLLGDPWYATRLHEIKQ